MPNPLGVRSIKPAARAEVLELRRALVKAAAKRRPRPRGPVTPLEPRLQEAAYVRDIIEIYRDLRELTIANVLLPVKVGVVEGLREDAKTSTVMGSVRVAVARRVSVERATKVATKHAEAVEAFNGREISRQVETVIGIKLPSIVSTEPQVKAFISDNIKLIKSLTGDALDQVEDVVAKGVLRGARVETVAKEISERLDVAESRARLIARDQVGKFNGELTQVRQTAIGAKSYTWRTSQDARVRDEHRGRDGTDYKWADPPEDGHPGIPINCRCTAQFVVEDLLASLGI